MSPLDTNPSIESDDELQARRFAGIRRDYSAEEVARLSGSVRIDYTLAEMGAAACGSCCTPGPTSIRWAR